MFRLANTFLVLLLLCGLSNLQSQNQQLLSSGGQHNFFTGLNLDWSVGEPVVATAKNGHLILTQGFHQGFTQHFSPPDSTLYRPLGSIELFPNPAKDFVNLVFRGEFGENGTYILFNAQGKALKSDKIIGNSAKVKVSDLKSGLYIFRLSDHNSNLIGSRKFIKK